MFRFKKKQSGSLCHVHRTSNKIIICTKALGRHRLLVRDNQSGIKEIDLIKQMIKKPKYLAVHLFLAPNDYKLYVCDKPEVPDEELTAAVRFALVRKFELDEEHTVCQTFVNPRPHAKTQNNQVFAVISSRHRLMQLRDEYTKQGLNLVSISIPELNILKTVSQSIAEDSFAFLYGQETVGILLIVEQKLLVARYVLPILERVNDLKKNRDVVEQFILSLSRQLQNAQLPEDAKLFINPTALQQAQLLKLCRHNLDIKTYLFKYKQEQQLLDKKDFYQYGLRVWI